VRSTLFYAIRGHLHERVGLALGNIQVGTSAGEPCKSSIGLCALRDMDRGKRGWSGHQVPNLA
jgi:hypothetical protein